MTSYRGSVLAGVAFVVAGSLPFVAIARDADRPAATRRSTAAAPASPSASHDMTGMDHGSKIDFEAMDKTMRDRTKAFPAKTEGVGAQALRPTVLPDGTKRFVLTAKIVKWEVEPGRTVDAWTYNGTVPGPTIRVEVGDKVEVVVHNELPESTAVHFHGVRLPNSQDGVPDITQDPIKPHATYTYRFTATRAAVGMYHSHHDAVVQVPNGLAGAFLIGHMPVPHGVKVSQELPMMLDDSGTVGLAINGKSFPATAPIVARQGDWVEVHYLNEGVSAHPMHLHGLDQLVIAKDGYPLPQPYLADTILVGPGERYTVLVHADVAGVWAWHCHILSHAENAQGMFGMVTAMVVQ
jgi:FtsP/CotA-like multicopper oxidase with cupredoxin domain